MKDEPLPNEHHISRYCKFTSLSEQDGLPTGDSFALPDDQKYLSVHWLEFYGGLDRKAQLKRVRQDIRLKLRQKGKFAVLNVGEMIAHVHSSDSHNCTLSVLHVPEEKDPAHSGIYGYTHEDDMVTELIAQKVKEIYPALENSD